MGILTNRDSMLIHFTSRAQGLSTYYEQKWSLASSYSHLIKQTSEHVVWHKPPCSRKAPNDERADVTSWDWIIVNCLPPWALCPVPTTGIFCCSILLKYVFAKQLNTDFYYKLHSMINSQFPALKWCQKRVNWLSNKITTQK